MGIEDKFIEAVRKYCGDRPRIADIGAREGTQTRKFCSEFPDGEIVAFEPNPYWRDKLKSKRFKHYEVAISDREGTADFYVVTNDNKGASSLLEPPKKILPHDSETKWEKIKVRTKTLNDYTPFDALWMDVQGAEKDVIDCIGKPPFVHPFNTPSIIATECETKPVYEGAVQFPELNKYMFDRFYVLTHFEQDWEKEANLLYIREDLL